MGVSLLVDVLLLLRARMPGLREMVFVPRDEDPSYSGDVCVGEPAMVHSRLAGIVREAMALVFVDQRPSERPWSWRIMTLGADADVRVHNWQVLCLDAAKEQEDVKFGNVHGLEYTRPGWKGKKHWKVKGRELMSLNILQESVRKDLLHLEMGAHAVPVVVE